MGMMKNTGGGEIVQVQGGHIVRNTGRKDRHSKVFTAKGPRDRRVRLSAHTAIQFYDVQDRLGYDRPSKAVDWLIKKAKSAIDKLAELPPWHPTTTPAANNNNTTQEQEDDDEDDAPEIGIPDHETESSGYNFQFNQTNPENHHSFMTSQIDSDAIAFFPTTYPSSAIISTRNTNNPSEDLGLSLHSFQDSSGLIHSQSSQVAADANPGGFLSWNNVLGSSFAQRGTLQSSFSSGWNDIAMNTNNSNNNSSSANHNNNNNNNKSSSQASIFGSRFVSDAMGIHGFCIPARIQGEEEEDDHHHGIASHHHHHHHRPASSASNSHH